MIKIKRFDWFASYKKDGSLEDVKPVVSRTGYWVPYKDIEHLLK